VVFVPLVVFDHPKLKDLGLVLLVVFVPLVVFDHPEL